MFKSSNTITSDSGSNAKSKRLGLIIVLSILLILSGMVNILLSRELSFLRSSLQSKMELGIGESVQSLIAHSLNGTPTTIMFSGQKLPTILYVFSPQCIWCTRNRDNIKLIEEAARGKYQMVGLSTSTSSLEQYIADNDFTFPVYKEPDERSRLGFRLGGTPEMLVISPEGKVVKNWHGALEGDQKIDAENFFKVKLPGLRMETVTQQNTK